MILLLCIYIIQEKEEGEKKSVAREYKVQHVYYMYISIHVYTTSIRIYDFWRCNRG